MPGGSSVKIKFFADGEDNGDSVGLRTTAGNDYRGKDGGGVHIKRLSKW